MQRKILLLQAITVLMSTLMCVVPNLDTEYFAKSEPGHQDLVGEYRPTQATLQLLQDKGNYALVDIVIYLMDDGSFQVTNMPDWWQDITGESNGTFGSFQGAWNVAKAQEWWELELDFDADGITDMSLILVGQEAPYYLWRYIGDPDEGDVMIFERVNDDTPTE